MGRQQQLPRARKPEFKCFNCEGLEHAAKDCKHPCKICKKTNHTSYNCFRRKNREHVKVFQDEGSEDSQDQVNLSPEQNSVAQDSLDELLCLGENVELKMQDTERDRTIQKKCNMTRNVRIKIKIVRRNRENNRTKKFC